MRQRWSAAHRQSVALLAEGVDRNCKSLSLMPRSMPSPSSRRAWVEICKGHWVTPCWAVALLAEGVDRNIVAIDQFDFLECRPPRGEHTSNPLSIRLHSLSFLQAGHRFGGQQPFSTQTRWRKMPPAGVSTLAISFSCTTADRYPLWQ